MIWYFYMVYFLSFIIFFFSFLLIMCVSCCHDVLYQTKPYYFQIQFMAKIYTKIKRLLPSRNSNEISSDFYTVTRGK